MVLHMCTDRAFKGGELSSVPTTGELLSLAEECEGLAEACIAAAAKISSINNPYRAVNVRELDLPGVLSPSRMLSCSGVYYDYRR